ncbi:MAG TPA: hypothetical protein VFZ21_14590 [Gemmatimonadaceae bacterium]|nr:hypothetical protein [Gemmatimonadaceae bacterium]
MFIELVDALRCLEPHEDTWLVASVTRWDGRHILDGVLGCPVCRREYVIADGVAWFTDPVILPGAPRLTTSAPAASSDRVARAAALLGLTDGGGTIVLGGDWVECADALVELGAGQVVLVNAVPSSAGAQEVSSIAIGGRLPFAAGALRGVALGGEAATAPLVASGVGALRPRGRLVAPSAVTVPDGVTELARDAEDWVAERVGVISPLIGIRGRQV